ncbi:hypothetical protein B0H17DRAFT_1327138 [Mycena rosella]|uniref:Uncharacterized protein n=1 Tax=Mycena rosella TaxID=1033263 RepID=A0AAD7DZX5_MYCRO|nr:hypothetical protein B0H17DRAFT_1327138 [Mycena rosella]
MTPGGSYVPLYKTAAAVLSWMTSEEDSEMTAAFDNSDAFLEDRNRGSYHKCQKKSRWDGSLPKPTFVYGLDASLDDPPLRFRGFGVVENYPGDNPYPEASDAGTDVTTTLPAMASHKRPDRYADSRSTSSTDPRHYESPEHRENVLRHHAMTSRDRMQDEPYWQHDNRRSARCDERPWTTQCEHHAALAEEDRHRAREANIARSRGFAPPPTLPPSTVRDRRQRSNRDGSPIRTRVSPDLQRLPRGPDGHPQSAWAVAQTGPDPPDDEVVCPPANPVYVSLEELRISRVRNPHERRDGLPPARRVRDARALGMFFNAQIYTLEQAFNLCALRTEASQEAYEFFSCVVQDHAAFPLEFRSEGEAYLLTHQQELEHGYWFASTGEQRPTRTSRHPQAVPPSTPQASSSGSSQHDHQGRRNSDTPTSHANAAARAAPQMSMACIDTPRPPPRIAAPRPRQTTPPPDPAPGYLGVSPPDPTDMLPPYENQGFVPSAAVPSTRWNIGEITNNYIARHPSLWGLGIRNFLLRVASVLGNSPASADVLAYHTFIALSPAQRQLLAHQYHLFFDMAIRLFSIHGLFAHIIRTGQYPSASQPMAHYPYLMDNITLWLAAAWFVQHGIFPGTAAVISLEDFARVRHNLAAGMTNIGNNVWADKPRDLDSAMLRLNGVIPAWADLRHAALRPDLVTSSNGLSSSMHAPEMDVDPVVPGVVLSASGMQIVTEPIVAMPQPPLRSLRTPTRLREASPASAPTPE